MNESLGIGKNSLGTGPAMLAIFGAAMVIGLAFNSLSPLGVRPSQPAAPSQAPAAAAGLYENETIAVSLGGPPPSMQPAAAAPAGIYENETTGAHLEANDAGAAVQPSTPPGEPSISWLETKKLLAARQIVLVDARASVYYEAGHIPGSISLSAVDATPQNFAAFAAKYPRDTALVVYCGSVQCPLASQLTEILTGSMGYTNVREMPGGFLEYRMAANQASGGGAK